MTKSIPTITHTIEMLHISGLDRQYILGFEDEETAQLAHNKIVNAMAKQETCVVETCTSSVVLDGKHWCGASLQDQQLMEAAWARHKALLKPRAD